MSLFRLSTSPCRALCCLAGDSPHLTTEINCQLWQWPPCFFSPDVCDSAQTRCLEIPEPVDAEAKPGQPGWYCDNMQWSYSFNRPKIIGPGNRPLFLSTLAVLGAEGGGALMRSRFIPFQPDIYVPPKLLLRCFNRLCPRRKHSGFHSLQYSIPVFLQRETKERERWWVAEAHSPGVRMMSAGSVHSAPGREWPGAQSAPGWRVGGSELM